MTFEECHRSHHNCLMCGVDNPHSLGLKFEVISENIVATTFTGCEMLQGYAGCLHGGIISALLDCAMVHCLFHRGVIAVTTDLKVKFRQRISCDARVDIKGELLSARHGLHKLRAEISGDGKVLAEAEARFLQVDDL